MTFNDLGLDERILRGVAEMGHTEPMPIQSEAIPYILEGRDVVGCAQTGTGKTIAFMLPTLQRLSDRPGVKALVVTPTRELARQIHGVTKQAARHTGHKVAVVLGGVRYDQQIQKLQEGVDVVVATPGRLLDLDSDQARLLGADEIMNLAELPLFLQNYGGFLHKKVIL